MSWTGHTSTHGAGTCENSMTGISEGKATLQERAGAIKYDHRYHMLLQLLGCRTTASSHSWLEQQEFLKAKGQGKFSPQSGTQWLSSGPGTLAASLPSL